MGQTLESNSPRDNQPETDRNRWSKEERSAGRSLFLYEYHRVPRKLWWTLAAARTLPAAGSQALSVSAYRRKNDRSHRYDDSFCSDSALTPFL